MLSGQEGAALLLGLDGYDANLRALGRGGRTHRGTHVGGVTFAEMQQLG